MLEDLAGAHHVGAAVGQRHRVHVARTGVTPWPRAEPQDDRDQIHPDVAVAQRRARAAPAARRRSPDRPAPRRAGWPAASARPGPPRSSAASRTRRSARHHSSASRRTGARRLLAPASWCRTRDTERGRDPRHALKRDTEHGEGPHLPACPPSVGLLRASHPEPGAAVTAGAALLAMITGRDAARRHGRRARHRGQPVRRRLAQRLARRRPGRPGRPADKPIAAGAVSRRRSVSPRLSPRPGPCRSRCSPGRRPPLVATVGLLRRWPTTGG